MPSYMLPNQNDYKNWCLVSSSVIINGLWNLETAVFYTKHVNTEIIAGVFFLLLDEYNFQQIYVKNKVISMSTTSTWISYEVQHFQLYICCVLSIDLELYSSWLKFWRFVWPVAIICVDFFKSSIISLWHFLMTTTPLSFASSKKNVPMDPPDFDLFNSIRR